MTAPSLLHELLEAAAARAPEAVAIVDADRHCTFAELDRMSNQLAHRLIALDVGRGDRIGVHARKSIEAIAAIHGALKAGAAYVPLDPYSPVARNAGIVTDCGIRHIITDPTTAATTGDLARAAAVDHVIDAGPAGPGSEQVDRPRVAVSPDDLAYVLYTSGSTGRPKGVMLSHRNGAVFVDWAVREYAVTPDDRLSSHAPLHFDLSIFDLYASTAAAATLVLVPDRISMFPPELARFIHASGITVWYSVPSVLHLLARRGGLRAGALPNLRLVMFAGEVFPTPALRHLMGVLPHARFANLYGPTETNVCTAADVPPLADDDAVVPIGRAIDGVEVITLTDSGEPASVGAVGELYVRGPTVTSGYWGDRELTAQRLVPHPLGDNEPGRFFRTGDLARVRPDGQYEFVGRRDHQVKSRGHRVELAEIEHVLRSHPGVADAVVVAVPDDLLTNRLKAYVVAVSPVTRSDLTTVWQSRLPRYMIPTEVEIRSELPLTVTGKVDRRQLEREARGERS